MHIHASAEVLTPYVPPLWGSRACKPRCSGTSPGVQSQKSLSRAGGQTSEFKSAAPCTQQAHPAAPVAPQPEPLRAGAAEEVLLTALRESRRNLIGLQASQKALVEAIKREEMQFDRLQFAYKKAISEAAYVRTLEKLLERERQAALGRQA
ncbi:hypothetical protein WJX81_008026 [Elliptochloris bilobata]|uniref:Uncharacterized protein n=1 Tax=Elliptochloris bilobata TaxID=381761 RepID=A0AAW1SHJ0_9CHLO